MHETCLNFGILVHMKPMYTLGHCLPFLLHEMMTVHTPSVMRQGIVAISDDFAYPVLLICLTNKEDDLRYLRTDASYHQEQRSHPQNAQTLTPHGVACIYVAYTRRNHPSP